MFDALKVLEIISSQIVLLEKHFNNSHVDTSDMLSISNVENQLSALRDKVYAKYASGGLWSNQGYTTAKSAVVFETHQERRSVSKNILRGKMLNEFDSLSEALSDCLITSDHVDILCRVFDNKYSEFLERDIDLLVENAIKLDALHFSHVVKYWKNIVDDQLCEASDEYKSFESRRLFIDEMLDGNYLLHGILDKTSAINFKKAIEDIANKMWRNDDVEQRDMTSQAQYRADAAGYLGQMYLTSSNTEHEDLPEFKFSPSISSDVIINVEELYENQNTRTFLNNNLTKTTPIEKAHSKQFIKQLLCDTVLSVPVKNLNGTYDFGRKVRSAPSHLKRMLALQTNTCSIPGCSIPSSWCDAHHIWHWIDGGETKIENLVLLCRRHHTMIHNDKTFAEKASRLIEEFKNRHSPPQLVLTG